MRRPRRWLSDLVELFDLEVACDWVGFRFGDVVERLLPAHVGVFDAGVDQDDRAAQTPDADRFCILGIGGVHEFGGAVERLAVDCDEEHVAFDAFDQVAVGVWVAAGCDQDVAVEA